MAVAVAFFDNVSPPTLDGFTTLQVHEPVTVIDVVSLPIFVNFEDAVSLPLLVSNVHNPVFVALQDLVYLYPSHELAANVALELNVTVPTLPFNVG